MIKILAIDMDGTLLDEQKNISDISILKIQEAIQEGIQIVPCTGRTVDGIPSILFEQGISFVVASNGGLVWDVKERKEMRRVGIPCEVAGSLLKDLEPLDVHTYIQYHGDTYTNGNEYLSPKVKMNKPSLGIHVKQPLSQYVVDMSVNPEKMGIMTLEADKHTLALKLKEKYPMLHIQETSRISVEMSALEATKASGLEVIANHIGVVPNEIAAIGDSNNDLEMLEYAGESWAMENGTDEAKRKAKYVTSSNNENGVAKVIDSILESFK